MRHRHGWGHRRGSGPAASGGLAMAGALFLFAWGGWEAFTLTRLFHGGANAVGVITRVARESDDTRIRIGTAECPVTGDVGPVGRSVPVVHPHGRPIECVVRSPSAFRWSAGAMLLGGAIVLVFGYRARRDSRPR